MSMFRRKDEDGNDIAEMENTTAEMASGPALKPATAPAMSAAQAAPQSPAAPQLSATPVARPTTPTAASGFRPAPASASGSPARAGEMKPATMAGSAAAAAKPGKRILTVGNDILLKGEIATCDRLVIEGSVDARLNDVHTVEIAETGSFKGTAEIEDAEISGLFEGELTVRNRLTIYSTGRVRGKIAYGEIEIERGGQMTGDITISAASASSQAEKNKAA